MAKVRLTMNTTARRRLRKPQQHRLQSGASDWAEPGPAWVAALRFSGDSVAGSSIVELLHTLMFESGAAMARECCVEDDNDNVLVLVGSLRGARRRLGTYPEGQRRWTKQNKQREEE